TWLVGTISGFVGAFLAAIVLLATGMVGTPAAVIDTGPSRAPTNRTDPPAKVLPTGITALLSQVFPSIVGITVNGPSGVLYGSGVLMGENVGDWSYLVTDTYLFAAAGSQSQVQVTTDWGQTANGDVVATDPELGIALVKAVLLPVSEAASDGADIGSVGGVQTGEEVFAVGSRPMAASTSVSAFTAGYMNDTLVYLPPSGDANAVFSMLPANLSVDSPDYGGAVVDASSGLVLGITSQVPNTPDGLTYVVPIDTVVAVVSQMMKTQQAGPVPWLGVLQATDIANGIQVESVGTGSPVARAGVQDNDVIISLDGRSIATVGAMIAWLSNARPGQVMSIGWLHNGHLRSAVLTLGAQPTSAAQS
ncbi:MAG TPA: S1C family serine protease, partial [Acidimicrobiales bacterium]|nr:S1C family serine protease [Acidimicrobiales bacterium]